MRFFLILIIASGMSFGASKPLPMQKLKLKRKSLTTAQLFNKGPFMGCATLAAPSMTVYN
ncbi:MAG: hypothetical protein ACKN9V_00950 [Pseudomonadota bacterium]